MSKFQVASSNSVGCGDDTDRHIHVAMDQTQRKDYFTSRIRNLTLLRGLDWLSLTSKPG